MGGFFLGTLVGASLSVALGQRRRRRHEAGACGPTHGVVRWLSRRLDATPEQARVIRSEVQHVFDALGDLRRELRRSRGDVSAVLEADAFDAAGLDGMFARHDERLRHLREAVVGALGRFFEVLDGRQRERLAQTLGYG